MTRVSGDRATRILKRLTQRGLDHHAKRIAEANHVFLSEMLSKSRHAPIVRARLELLRCLHDDARLSWPMIAEMFETQSASIMHATTYRETRVREALERPVIKRIATYVRELGYDVLASDIENEVWRPVSTKRRDREGNADGS